MVARPVWRERPGLGPRIWRERQAEAYMARVLAETNWYREAWSLWMSALVRPLASVGRRLYADSWETGAGGCCRAISPGQSDL